MKLATLANGTRDGTLTLVSHDRGFAVPVDDIAVTLQDAIERWGSVIGRGGSHTADQDRNPFSRRIRIKTAPISRCILVSSSVHGNVLTQ